MMVQAVNNWYLLFFLFDIDNFFFVGWVFFFFIEGNFKDYDDVYNFGKDKQVFIIEIEYVNIEVLYQLEKEGVKVYFVFVKLDIIKDKGL